MSFLMLLLFALGATLTFDWRAGLMVLAGGAIGALGVAISSAADVERAYHAGARGGTPPSSPFS